MHFLLIYTVLVPCYIQLSFDIVAYLCIVFVTIVLVSFVPQINLVYLDFFILLVRIGHQHPLQCNVATLNVWKLLANEGSKQCKWKINLIHSVFYMICSYQLERVRWFTISALTHWVISISCTVFMNKNSGRIRTLSWYSIIAYPSHNTKDDHLTHPREGPRLHAWVSRYHLP